MLRSVSSLGRFQAQHGNVVVRQRVASVLGQSNANAKGSDAAGLVTPASMTIDVGRNSSMHHRLQQTMKLHTTSVGMGMRNRMELRGMDQRRFNSTSTGADVTSTATAAGASQPAFEDTMDKLFHDTQKVAQDGSDEWFLDQAASVAWEPSWYNLADQAVNGVHLVHDMTGLEYAASIVAVTCTLRMLILPLAIRGQRAASRMAHLQPELAQLKERYEKLGTPTQAEQKVFADQMKAVFKKYDVKPFAAMAAPMIQAPLFIGMFFGMKKMPDLFPTELSTGGLAWFTDLTVADPTFILPITCGMTFLATIEAGKEQMMDSNPKYGPVMVNAFRAMAVVMVPVMTTFPAAMLCYWVPNNLFSMGQSILLRNGMVKEAFGIWERPKPVPGAAQDAGFQETLNNLVKKAKGEPTTEAAKMKAHNEEIETRKQVAQMSRSTRAKRRGGVATRRQR